VLVIQHAKRMYCIMLSSVASMSLPYFYTLSHKKGMILRKMLLNIKFMFDFFCNISHSKQHSARYHH